jgi:hypothetical protein
MMMYDNKAMELYFSNTNDKLVQCSHLPPADYSEIIKFQSVNKLWSSTMIRSMLTHPILIKKRVWSIVIDSRKSSLASGILISRWNDWRVSCSSNINDGCSSLMINHVLWFNKHKKWIENNNQCSCWRLLTSNVITRMVQYYPIK